MNCERKHSMYPEEVKSDLVIAYKLKVFVIEDIEILNFDMQNLSVTKEAKAIFLLLKHKVSGQLLIVVNTQLEYRDKVLRLS